MSQFFIQEQGLRQSCNLFPPLFILAAEFLSCKVRQSENICGIELLLADYELRDINQFGDDTSIFVNGENSIENIINVLDSFAKISCLHLNKSKILMLTVLIGSCKIKKGNIN